MIVDCINMKIDKNIDHLNYPYLAKEKFLNRFIFVFSSL